MTDKQIITLINRVWNRINERRIRQGDFAEELNKYLPKSLRRPVTQGRKVAVCNWLNHRLVPNPYVVEAMKKWLEAAK